MLTGFLQQLSTGMSLVHADTPSKWMPAVSWRPKWARQDTLVSLILPSNCSQQMNPQ